jgi:hypothetical protein
MRRKKITIEVEATKTFGYMMTGSIDAENQFSGAFACP